jgi:hypothetical protein
MCVIENAVLSGNNPPWEMIPAPQLALAEWHKTTGL